MYSTWFIILFYIVTFKLPWKDTTCAEKDTTCVEKDTRYNCLEKTTCVEKDTTYNCLKKIHHCAEKDTTALKRQIA